MATQESRLIISIDARNAEQRAKDLARELQNITTAGGNADRQVNQMSSSIRSLAGYMAGLVTVGTAISKMDAYTGLQNRLKLVTSGQEQLTQAMNDTFKIAQETAQAWDSVAQVYQRFADNAKTLGITLDQTASLTNTVAKAIAVSGGSAASAEAALVQFGQALASGVLRGEEFNSIAEQAPALLKAIASGLDVNIGQLRAMAGEGKLTGDVVIKSLEKAKVSVDELFAKTDFTVANSFTQLNNAVIQFVGEAGKANGAASVLSASIKSLADNLDTIANVAVLGGVALLTKAILTQVAATKTAVAAAVARRASMFAELQGTTQVTAAEVSRTAVIAQLRAMQLADAKATAARLTGMQRLAYVQGTVLPLERANTAAIAAHTAALSADTVAQGANTAARSRAAMLFGAVGGTVGVLTIGVTALAAGYMYMTAKTKEANAELERQASVAKQAADELKKLQGIEREKAIADMTTALKAQNEALEEASSKINMQLTAIGKLYEGNKEVAKIVEEARNGTITMTEAVNGFNKVQIKKDIYEAFKKNADVFHETTTAALTTQKGLKTLGKETEITGKTAQNAAVEQENLANATDDVANATDRATAAMQKYNQSLKDRTYDAVYVRTLREKHGYTKELAEETLKAQIALGRGTIGISKDTEATIKNTLAQEDRLNAIDEAEKAREKAQRKAEADAERAQRKADAAAKKAADDAERLAQQQAEMRLRIVESNLDDLGKIEDDYVKERQAIYDANFGKDEKKYLNLADKRYKYNLEMYALQVQKETNEFEWSETQKLAHWYRTQRKMIIYSGQFSKEVQKVKLEALEREHVAESANIYITMREREFQSVQQFLSETQRINEKHTLEVMRIGQIKDMEQRMTEFRLANLRKVAEETERIQNAQVEWAKIQSQLTGADADMAQIDQDVFDQTQASDALYNAEIAIADSLERREELYKQHEKRVEIIEKKANEARLKLNLGYSESIFGSMAEMMAMAGEEQSKTYKIMFAASKAFAIAQSIMNIQTAMSSAAMSLPFPGNLGAMATVAAETMGIVASIKAVSDTGFKSGGYTGNMGVNDVAGVVHGREFVMTAEATKRVGVDTLNAVNNGGSLNSGNIVVQIQNIGASKEFEVEQLDANTVRIIARDEAEKTVIQSLRDPNSPVSKSIAQNTNAGRRRG